MVMTKAMIHLQPIPMKMIATELPTIALSNFVKMRVAPKVANRQGCIKIHNTTSSFSGLSFPHARKHMWPNTIMKMYFAVV